MSKYNVYINYPETGWVPVRWAPTFDNKADANAWIAEDGHDWDGRVEAWEEDEDE